MNCNLLYVKLTSNAFDLVKTSEYSVGFDLKSPYDAVIPNRGSGLIKTDLQVKLPDGTYGRIAPRSGLALKNKIDIGGIVKLISESINQSLYLKGGVIDPDYRGNVGVIIFNHGDEDFKVRKGDRIAQLICEKVVYPDILKVETLDDTERGERGFGSSGLN